MRVRAASAPLDIIRRMPSDSTASSRWHPDIGYWKPLPDLLLDAMRVLDLNPTDLAILLTLDRHRKDREPVVMKHAEIASAINVSDDTVLRRIKRMKENGIIEVAERRDEKGHKKAQGYTRHGLEAKLLRLTARQETE